MRAQKATCVNEVHNVDIVGAKLVEDAQALDIFAAVIRHGLGEIHLPKSRQGLTLEYVETINQYQPLHCHTAPPHSLLILQFVNIHDFINDGINGEPRHRVNIELAHNVFAVRQHRVERNKELLGNLFV